MARKRNNQVCVRFSDSEYEEYLHKLEQTNLTQNDFFLRAVAGAVIPSAEQSDELKKLNNSIDDLYKQIRGIATNINQLTRLANKTLEVPALAVLNSTAQDINKIRQELNRAWDQIRQEIKQGV